MDRLLRTVPGLTPAGTDDVRWVFASINHDLAPIGAQIQRRDGTWLSKE
jgi:hypothetical protein